MSNAKYLAALITVGLAMSVRPSAGQAPTTDACFQMSDSCNAGLNCLPTSGLLSPDYTQQVAVGFAPDPVAPQCGRNRLTKVACGDLESSPCDSGGGGAGGGGGSGGGCERGAGGVCPAQCSTCGQAFGVLRKLPPEALARLQAASLPQSVNNLLAEFAKIQTAHLRAAVVVNDADSPHDLQRVRSTYEYWGKGGLFRIHSPLDPRLALSYVTDVAFNGEIWQVVTEGKSSINTMTLDGSDHMSAPTFLDNPLFLPLSFLSPSGAPWLTIDFYVDTLEINAPIDDGTFVIPPALADRIWDGDQKVWLKTDLALRPCQHWKPTGVAGPLPPQASPTGSDAPHP
jgi:hypothetical protein